MFDKKLVCVTGLPRSGSTLLCQLLAHHPDIYCPGNTSPLLQMLMGLRHGAADNEMLLAYLDSDPEAVHEQLMTAYKGFVSGWFNHAEQPVVVDKNRSWIAQMDLATRLDNDSRMLVCVRDLGQIFGSIESRHQKTLAIDFADHLAGHTLYDRANSMFSKNGVVGIALDNFRSAQDLPVHFQQRILCILFEELVSDPHTVLNRIWPFIGLDPVKIDTDNLRLLPRESDSHYRMKFTHATHSKINPATTHSVPKRIEAEIQNSYEWFYKIFYPEKIAGRQ